MGRGSGEGEVPQWAKSLIVQVSTLEESLSQARDQLQAYGKWALNVECHLDILFDASWDAKCQTGTTPLSAEQGQEAEPAVAAYPEEFVEAIEKAKAEVKSMVASMHTDTEAAGGGSGIPPEPPAPIATGALEKNLRAADKAISSTPNKAAKDGSKHMLDLMQVKLLRLQQWEELPPPPVPPPVEEPPEKTGPPAETTDDKLTFLRLQAEEFESDVKKDREEIEAIKADIARKDTLQKARDDAQDEMINMDLTRIKKSMKSLVSKEDMGDINRAMENTLTAAKSMVESKLEELSVTMNVRQDKEFDKIYEWQLKLQQSTNKESDLLNGLMRELEANVTALRGSSTTTKKETDATLSTIQTTLAESAGRSSSNTAKVGQLMELIKSVETNAQKMATDTLGLAQKVDNVKTLMAEEQSESSSKFESELRALRNMTEEIKETMEKNEEVVQSEIFDQTSGHAARIVEIETNFEEMDKTLETQLDKLGILETTEMNLSEKLMQLSQRTIELDDGWKVMLERHSKGEEHAAGVNAKLQTLWTDVREFQKETGDTLQDNDATLVFLKEENVARKQDDADLTTSLEAKFDLLKAMLADLDTEIKTNINTAVDLAKEHTKEECGKLASSVKNVGVQFSNLKSGFDSLNRNTNNSGATMNKLMNKFVDTSRGTLSEQNEKMRDLEKRFGRISVGMSMTINKLSNDVDLFARGENKQEKFINRLNAHADILGKECSFFESGSMTRSEDYMNELIAKNIQVVAKLLSLRADFVILRRAINGHFEESDLESVSLQVRNGLTAQFMEKISQKAQKVHPINTRKPEGAGLESFKLRGHFCTTVKQALELALTKYQSVAQGNTLFGKTKLQPACLACNRPFHKNKHGHGSPTRDGGPDHGQDETYPEENSTSPHHAPPKHQGGGGRGTMGPGNNSNYIMKGGFRMPKCSSTPNMETMANLKTLKNSSSVDQMKPVAEASNEDGRFMSHGGSQGNWLPQVHMGVNFSTLQGEGGTAPIALPSLQQSESR
jgi:hypothetical protein